MKRSSLEAQIAEVEREIGMRKTVYPGLVARRRMKQGEADLARERMEDVLATLRFLKDHRAEFLRLVREKEAPPATAEAGVVVA